MKTLLTVIFLLISFAFIKADDEKFIKAMEKNMVSMDTASSSMSFQAIGNNFERIAAAEKDKWQPYYYSAYCLIITSFIDSTRDKKDVYLDRAEKLLSLADSLKPNDSEIYTLKGMLGQARMVVDPMNRYQKYGQSSQADLQKAKELNPDNPRPDYLIANTLLYTPENFGGGKKVALPVFNQALEKYKKFKPENSIAPNWGQKQVEATIASIQQ